MVVVVRLSRVCLLYAVCISMQWCLQCIVGVLKCCADLELVVCCPSFFFLKRQQQEYDREVDTNVVYQWWLLVAFSMPARSLGECSTIYSPPALFFFFFLLAHTNCTLYVRIRICQNCSCLLV